jgi:RNA polymerase sigma-70 factor (ECF subfamily)
MDKDLEITLVRNCQKGDRKALEMLVTSLQKPVYNAAYRMLGNAEDAADATQATFLKVFENIGNFDPQYRLFSWTYRIAVNESLDRLKERRRSAPLEHDPEAVTGSPRESASAAQAARDLQAALMELSEDQRTVIVLRYFNECSYDDIAQILGIPAKTVKSRLFSARQQMKDRLPQHGAL